MCRYLFVAATGTVVRAISVPLLSVLTTVKDARIWSASDMFEIKFAVIVAVSPGARMVLSMVGFCKYSR